MPAENEANFAEWMKLPHCKQVCVDVNTGRALVSSFQDKLLSQSVASLRMTLRTMFFFLQKSSAYSGEIKDGKLVLEKI